MGEDDLHFVQGISGPQEIKEDAHGHQSKENTEDAIAGNRERGLDGELLQVYDVKGKRKLDAKIRQP